MPAATSGGSPTSAASSHNWTLLCWVLKMDIRGYFMHIDRHRLLDIALRRLSLTTNCTNCTNYSDEDIGAGRKTTTDCTNNHPGDSPLNINSCNSCNSWSLKSFLFYLTREIVLLDPTENCRIKGTPADWRALPGDKSLFRSPPGCGLPIGNLTSQLFSNVYLGRLDDYMKRTLKCRRYGCYVDDFYVVSCSREWLHSLIECFGRVSRIIMI